MTHDVKARKLMKPKLLNANSRSLQSYCLNLDKITHHQVMLLLNSFILKIITGWDVISSGLFEIFDRNSENQARPIFECDKTRNISLNFKYTQFSDHSFKATSRHLSLIDSRTTNKRCDQNINQMETMFS